MLTSSLFYLPLFVFIVGANFSNNNGTSGSNSTVTIIITTTATIEPLPSGAGKSSSAASNLDAVSSTASNTSLTAPTNTTSADLTKATIPVSKLPKRGIAYPAVNNPEDVLNINQTRSVLSWIYDWAVSPPDYLEDTGIEYVPMQWGEGNIENLASTIERTGAKTLLAFNEPDFDEQSNLDPTYAAELWMEYIEPLKAKGVRLGGPAVTASGTGRPWLKDFFAACGNCSIDFLPLHWYGEGTEGFYNYLWEIHGEWPKYDIWITEYADTRTNYDDVLDFMNATATYMEGIEWIERYSWFGYFRPENNTYYNMLHSDGGLNALGEFYIGAGSVEKSGRATHSPSNPIEGGPTRVLSTAVVGSNLATPLFSSASRVLAESRGWIIILVISMVLFCL